MNQNLSSITLAGGCFWGVEELFRNEPGVVKTEVGYTGGHSDNPTYEEVKTGQTGHAEAIEVTYDKNQTNLKNLLHFFFSIHDPTTLNRQGNDIGSQYRSAIYYNNDEEKQIAKEVIEEVKAQNFWQKPIVTELIAFKKFYSAESYHQDYLQKHPNGYTCHFKRY